MIADRPTPPPVPTSATARDWEAIERRPDFKALVAAKWHFIIPATVFFLVYYFALPILTGYAPALMATPLIGPVNAANLFALSQFVMVAVIMTMYVRRATGYDSQAESVVRHIETDNA